MCLQGSTCVILLVIVICICDRTSNKVYGSVQVESSTKKMDPYSKDEYLSNAETLHGANRRFDLNMKKEYLDNLISQMSNNSKNASIDWTSFGVEKANDLQLQSDEDGPVRRGVISRAQFKQETDPEPETSSKKGSTEDTTANSVDESDDLNPYSLGKQLQQVMSDAEYTNVTISVIGRTVEYNEIILMTASSSKEPVFRADQQKIYADDGPEKKIIFIVHGLTLMGFNQVPCLIKMKKFLSLVRAYYDHLHQFDIYIVPMANPDGLAYSYRFPLWNKNLSPQEACPGVALDRNFDVGWSVQSKKKSCSQQFAGEHPFSESESQAIRDIIHRFSHKIAAYIHVHAGEYHEHIYKGDAVLYPRGYSDQSPDDDRMIDLKGEVEEAMKNASFKAVSVTVDTLYSWYGLVSGTSVDYASTVYGIPYCLEFVMQLYEDEDPYNADPEESTSHAAQVEIWYRLIDSIFNLIYRQTSHKSAPETGYK